MIKTHVWKIEIDRQEKTTYLSIYSDEDMVLIGDLSKLIELLKDTYKYMSAFISQVNEDGFQYVQFVIFDRVNGYEIKDCSQIAERDSNFATSKVTMFRRFLTLLQELSKEDSHNRFMDNYRRDNETR